MENKTTITVSDEIWKELNKKKRRGDSMDDVLRRFLNNEWMPEDDE